MTVVHVRKYITPNTKFKLILGLYTWFGSQGAGALGHVTSKRALTSKVVSVCVCVFLTCPLCTVLRSAMSSSTMCFKSVSSKEAT